MASLTTGGVTSRGIPASSAARWAIFSISSSDPLRSGAMFPPDSPMTPVPSISDSVGAASVASGSAESASKSSSLSVPSET